MTSGDQGIRHLVVDNSIDDLSLVTTLGNLRRKPIDGKDIGYIKESLGNPEKQAQKVSRNGGNSHAGT